MPPLSRALASSSHLPLTVQRTLSHDANYLHALASNPALDDELWHDMAALAMSRIRRDPELAALLAATASTDDQLACVVHEFMPLAEDDELLMRALLSERAPKRPLPASAALPVARLIADHTAPGNDSWDQDDLLERLILALGDDPVSRRLGRRIIDDCPVWPALEYVALHPHLSAREAHAQLTRWGRDAYDPNARLTTEAVYDQHPDLYRRALSSLDQETPSAIELAALSFAGVNHPLIAAEFTFSPEQPHLIPARLLALANPSANAATLAAAGRSADPDVAAWAAWRTSMAPDAVADWSTPADQDIHRWLLGTLDGTFARDLAKRLPLHGEVREICEMRSMNLTMLQGEHWGANPRVHQRIGELLANPHLSSESATTLLEEIPGLYHHRCTHLLPALTGSIQALQNRTGANGHELAGMLDLPEMSRLALPLDEIRSAPQGEQTFWCHNLGRVLAAQGASPRQWQQTLARLDEAPGTSTGNDLLSELSPISALETAAAAVAQRWQETQARLGGADEAAAALRHPPPLTIEDVASAAAAARHARGADTADQPAAAGWGTGFDIRAAAARQQQQAPVRWRPAPGRPR